MRFPYILILTFLFSSFTQYLTAQVYSEDYKSIPDPYLYYDEDKYGCSVSVDGDYAVIGSLGYNNQGCAYVLHFNGTDWETVARLEASDAEENAEFGSSVSISGNAIVIGAPFYNYSDSANPGAAYVFVKPSTGWTDATETAKLLVSEGNEFQLFGISVDISGDVIVVGEIYRGYDSPAGVVYVYEKPANGWGDMVQTAILSGSDSGLEDSFGYSLSISGNTIVSGAHSNDAIAENSGAIYVFEKPVSGWTDMTETAKLIPSDGDTNDYFGTSVDIYNDTIVVTATGDESNGSAYIFSKPASGNWSEATEDAKLLPADIFSEVVFGYSAAISGNTIAIGINGDDNTKAFVYERSGNSWTNQTESAIVRYSGYGAGLWLSVDVSDSNIFIGSRRHSHKCNMSGSVVVFEEPTEGWTDTTESYIIGPSPHLLNGPDSYGRSVDMNGDYSVIGAPDFKEGIGCAYVLYNNGTNWETIARLTSSVPNRGSSFGWSVCMTDSVIVIGSRLDTSVYVFEKPADGWKDMTETAILNPSDEISNSFGYSVDMSENTIVVGDPHRTDNVMPVIGSVYLFEMPEGGWVDTTETATLSASDGEDYDNFGHDVAIFENTVVVGARGDKDFGDYSGSAYIFEKPENGWHDTTETAKLTPSTGQPRQNFSSSMDISEDIIVIGALGDSYTGDFTGAAYLFEKPLGGWASMNETMKIQASDGTSGDYFGYSVEIYNERIIIGAANDYKGERTGSAYIFEKQNGDWTNLVEVNKIMPSDSIDENRFGTSISCSEDVIIVGAPGSGTMTGAAYFFNLPLENIIDTTQTTSYTNVKYLNEEIIVYPNPTNSRIEFKLTDSKNIEQIEVYNLDGRKVIQKTNTIGNQTIDFSGFNSGVYLIVFYSNDETYVKKVVKE